MSTCHQAHNIPWNTLVEVLHKVPPRHSNTTPDTTALQEIGFTVDEEGALVRKMKFFASKVDASIKDFSLTERRKYADKDIDNMSQVYDKESLNEWLKENLQNLSGWKEHEWLQSTHVEAVKELFIQEKTASLLLLARNDVKLESIQFVTHSNFFHCGVGRIKEDCLTLYIHLNLLLAMGTLQDPKKWHEQWRRFREQEILNLYDGNAHSRMYRKYFEENPNFEDLNGLQKLLKRLFRTLYNYDLVMAERGVNVSWKDEVLKCIGSYFCDRSTRKNFDNWYTQIREDENN